MRGKGGLTGLRINVKQGQKEFKKFLGFTVHWRRGVCGRTKPSKNRTKDSGGFEDKELSGVRSQPLTVSSPCPKALHQWRRILPRGQSCGDFSSFDWMDTELTVVTTAAGRSLRQLCSCSTTESSVVWDTEAQTVREGKMEC